MSARGVLVAGVAAAALLSAQAAEAAIVFGGKVGTSASAASGQVSVSVAPAGSGTVPPGDLVVVGEISASATSVGTTATDSQGNTYTCQPAIVAGSSSGVLCASLITHALTLGTDTVTANFSASGGNKGVVSGWFSGVASAAADVNTTNSGSGASLAATSGSAAQSGELMLALSITPNGWVRSSSSATALDFIHLSNVGGGLDYATPVGPGTVSYTMTWTGAASTWANNMVTLEAAGAGPTGPSGTSMSLTGVGHE